MEGRLRFKASRPVYRRGGLLLSSAAWVIAAVGDFDDTALLALVADPVVSIEGEVRADTWEVVPADVRAQLADLLRERLAVAQLITEPPADEADGGAQVLKDTQVSAVVPPPAETGQAVNSLAAGGGGAGEALPPNEPPPPPPPVQTPEDVAAARTVRKAAAAKSKADAKAKAAEKSAG